MEPGIARTEAFQYINKVRNVVVAARHQVAAAEVHPLQAREPTGEFLLDVHQRTFKNIGTALAVAVAVEAVYLVPSLEAFQFVGRNAEASAGSTGVVEVSAHLGILGVDAKADAQCGLRSEGPRTQSGELR